eukprot:Rmarinus@m.20476
MLPLLILALLFHVASASEYDANIQEVVNLIDSDYQHDLLVMLTEFHTRHSTGEGARRATESMAEIFMEYGFETDVVEFNKRFNSNVIANIPGTVNPEKIVIVGAHLDDRAEGIWDPLARAPGANDDGSGVALVMELARLIFEYDLTFDYTVRLALFGGEEQGAFGSAAYADEMVLADAQIVAMLQADMVAYLKPNSDYKVELSIEYTTPELTLRCMQLADWYVEGLGQQLGASCCSDQLPFFEAGFPATVYNEPGGYRIDPQYHSTGDEMDRPGFDFELLKKITQAVTAALCDFARLNSTPY